MEPTKEIRYYLAGKKSWSDVTMAVTRKDMPKKGQVINVGKIRMIVKDISDGIFNGRHITKVFLESSGQIYTNLDEAISKLQDPVFIEVREDINEAKNVMTGGYPGDSRIGYSGISGYMDTTKPVQANGPGSPGTLGNAVRSALSTLGAGYGAQVADFGEVVTVTITYSNAKTGRCSSQSFVILYRGRTAKNMYTVYANAGRWRNCNDYNQAIGFIRSKVGSIAGSANSPI